MQCHGLGLFLGLIKSVKVVDFDVIIIFIAHADSVNKLYYWFVLACFIVQSCVLSAFIKRNKRTATKQ